MNASTTLQPRFAGSARRLLIVLLVIAAAFALLPLEAKPAHAASGMAYSKGFGCEVTSFGRRVVAYPPNMTSTTGQMQVVYWSPDLYRWDAGNSRWAKYDGTKPWNYAVANSSGVMYNSMLYSSWFTPSNNALRFVPFTGLPRGYYKVADFYRWGSTGHVAPGSYVAAASAWAPYRAGGAYCYIP